MPFPPPQIMAPWMKPIRDTNRILSLSSRTGTLMDALWYLSNRFGLGMCCLLDRGVCGVTHKCVWVEPRRGILYLQKVCCYFDQLSKEESNQKGLWGGCPPIMAMVWPQSSRMVLRVLDSLKVEAGIFIAFQKLFSCCIQAALDSSSHTWYRPHNHMLPKSVSQQFDVCWLVLKCFPWR